MSESQQPATPRRGGPSSFADGATAGIGSLPHTDLGAAAAFAIGEFDIATVPTLPQRSIAETMLAQAVVGIPGVTIDDDGSPVVASAPPRDGDAILIDLDHDAFRSLHAFLELAVKVNLDGAPVKWQFVGPVTLGLALEHAGVDAGVAFELAGTVVRAHLAALSEAIADVLPSSPQMVLLDEPWFAELMTPGFPLAPDHAIDLMSSAMAALPTTTVAGVHCCAPCDIATLLSSGPRVISMPVSRELVDWAGYLTRFLDEGGIVAWGAVPTDGPVPSLPDRPWRALSDLWCALVQRGCDPVMLRRQSIVTPQCGLAWHSASVARRIARLNADVGTRVKDQSTATRFALGA